LDIREVGFENVAYTGEVGADRVRSNVMTHKDNIKGKGVWCGGDWEAVNFTEVKIQVYVGGVGELGGSIEAVPKCYGTFTFQLLEGPGFLKGLPGPSQGSNHNLDTPITS
jgi:hypothetical protein